jgi:DNA-binding transcriptional MerR regulator
VEAYVIRYWETEFNEVKPVRSNKQRLYRRKDVELLLNIKRLLHEEGYTIAGAQKKVKSSKKTAEQVKFDFAEDAYRSVLKEIREELIQIRNILKKDKVKVTLR